MKDISILIPYKPDHGHRDVAFQWTRAYYKKMMPEAELCIGNSDTELFSRSQAINNAAKLATRNVFVIADADLIYDPACIFQAMEFLEEHAWVIPFSGIRYLDKNSTLELLQKDPVWPIAVPSIMDIKPEVRGFVGGVNIVPREKFEMVGGFDERFRGWGGEDYTFAYSLNTLCGHYKRINADMCHLWHPSMQAEGNPNYKANYQLYRRYCRAAGDKRAIQKLINERLIQ